jgi:hypothetical protein
MTAVAGRRDDDDAASRGKADRIEVGRVSLCRQQDRAALDLRKQDVAGVHRRQRGDRGIGHVHGSDPVEVRGHAQRGQRWRDADDTARVVVRGDLAQDRGAVVAHVGADAITVDVEDERRGLTREVLVS